MNRRQSRGIMSIKVHEKILRKYEWNMQHVWKTIKRPNLRILSIEEGEEI
jgi:hypothetical protein